MSQAYMDVLLWHSKVEQAFVEDLAIPTTEYCAMHIKARTL